MYIKKLTYISVITINNLLLDITRNFPVVAGNGATYLVLRWDYFFFV